MNAAVINGEWTLTEEQEKEFDTPLLQEFARNFLRFQHSSPCTTNRKRFRYFEPLKEEDLTDDEVIYGYDREKAYSELMTSFKVCRIAGEFDKFFVNKKLYWQSKTMTKIVIMKKWLD